MNNELPKVFANKINKEINNSQDVYSSLEINNTVVNEHNISKKINDIFSDLNFVYKKEVTIVTKEKKVIKTIVGINGNKLLTMDNENIDISTIIDIY